MRYKILIVEDNQKLARLFQQALDDHFETYIASSLKEAHSYLKDIQGILLDLQLPDGEGLELIRPAQEANLYCVIIVVTAYGTIQKAVKALKLGAADFLEKPVDLEALAQRFRDLLPSPKQRDLVFKSTRMSEILQEAERVASTPLPVLITGETGTGKEVLAHYIHQHSARKRFIGLNCASMPPELADSMLFGHLRGSFTGAAEARRGLLSAADGGTLFLDEVGDLPISLQPKLLRFLDSGHYLQLGDIQESKSDVRIIAATNRDLQEAIKKGSFREDLYFRLSSFPLHIPPLRERKEDIMPLVRFHLDRSRDLLGRKICLSDRARELLSGYTFPGNVRELFNILDRAALLTGGNITSSSLRPLLKAPSEEGASHGDFWTKSRTYTLEKERELIDKALAETGGNKAATARNLKISYKTLLNKMKKLGMM